MSSEKDIHITLLCLCAYEEKKQDYVEDEPFNGRQKMLVNSQVLLPHLDMGSLLEPHLYKCRTSG